MEKRPNVRRSGLEIVQDAREAGHEIVIGNTELPIALFANEIKESVRDNVFTIVISETGSGKTTQVPQFLFTDLGMTVGNTQPRRGAAHEVGARIQEELAAAIPGLHPNTVGVHTGEERTVGPETQITIYTDGMLLAKDYNSTTNVLAPGNAKENHVTIVDELHEWNKNMEVLMGLLMQEAKTNPNLRVVVMTATPNKDFLVERLVSLTGIEPNIIEVPGRTHPITYHERNDVTPVEMALELARPGAGILVFDQGVGEVSEIIRDIKRGLPVSLRDKAHIFSYHGKTDPRERSEACRFLQGEDEIKIVVGTNAMESSLTIDGIHYVVDSGRARQIDTDKRGFQGLFSTNISRARCTQRAGRSGRLSPGNAYLVKPDSRTPFVSFDDRQEHDIPEIQRMDLKNVVLELAAIGIDLEQFPIVNEIEEKLKIISAKESLVILGALDDDGLVTDIGIEMNQYPVRATLKRTIVESRKYSEDIQRFVAAMAAAIESGGLPQYGRFAKSDWKELSTETNSDLLSQLDLYIEALHMSNYQQHQIGLNPKNIATAKETNEKILYTLGIDGTVLTKPNELQREEIKQCIYAGYVEHIFQRVGRTTFRLLQDTENTVFKLSDRGVVDPRHPQMVVGVPYFVERMRRGKTEIAAIIESTTVVPSIDVLGAAAVHMARWSPPEVQWSGGRAFIVEKQSIKGIRTGVTKDRMGDEEAIETHRTEFMRRVLDNPGPNQRDLRKIKKDLEELNHLSRDGITVMKQEAFLEFLSMALENLTEMDEHLFDVELLLIMQKYDICINTYVRKDEIARVKHDAPSQHIVGGETVDVVYRNGRATVRRYKKSTILALKQNVYLPDERDVRFIYNKREWNALDLKREFEKAAN